MRRCYYEKHPRYPDWGGRGIYVCDRWHNYLLFKEDMGERPKGHTLNRKDNDGPYSPDNCEWATPLEQNLNTRLRKDNSTGERNISPTGYNTFRVNIYRNGKRFISKCLSLDLAIELRDFTLEEMR